MHKTIKIYVYYTINSYNIKVFEDRNFQLTEKVILNRRLLFKIILL